MEALIMRPSGHCRRRLLSSGAWRGPDRLAPFGISSELHLQLAEVLAAQKPDECTRRLLDALDDVFLVFNASRADPLAHLQHGRSKLVGEVRDDEAAHAHRSEERRVEKECRSRWSTYHEKKIEAQ